MRLEELHVGEVVVLRENVVREVHTIHGHWKFWVDENGEEWAAEDIERRRTKYAAEYRAPGAEFGEPATQATNDQIDLFESEDWPVAA